MNGIETEPAAVWSLPFNFQSIGNGAHTRIQFLSALQGEFKRQARTGEQDCSEKFETPRADAEDAVHGQTRHDHALAAFHEPGRTLFHPFTDFARRRPVHDVIADIGNNGCGGKGLAHFPILPQFTIANAWERSAKYTAGDAVRSAESDSGHDIERISPQAGTGRANRAQAARRIAGPKYDHTASWAVCAAEAHHGPPPK